MATAIRYGSVYKTFDSGVDIGSGDGDISDVASVGLTLSTVTADVASHFVGFSVSTLSGAGGPYTALGTTWDPYCPD